jgi:hypothetical protein
MFLQAILSALYLAASISLYLKRQKGREASGIPRIRDAKFADRIRYAFYGTVSDFFLTSVIFDVGLAIGVLSHLGTKDRDLISGADVFVASFCLMGMAGVAPIFLWKSRRQWLRMWMIGSMVWSLASAALVWSVTISISHGLRDDFQRSLCPKEYVTDTYRSVFYASVTLGVLLPPTLCAAYVFVSPFWRCDWRQMWKKDWVRHAVRGSTVGISGLCFLFSWATLALLVVFVSGTSWFMRTSWGVGQGLALAMWMPLLWEIVYTMRGLFGPVRFFHATLPG